MPRLSKPLGCVVAVMLIYFLSRTAVMLLGLEGWASRPPLWDPAAHALDGIHFARAFRHFSASEFFVQMHNSGMWPPAIPLFQAPFQLAFGESFVVTRSWTAWMSIPVVLMVFMVGFTSHKRFGLTVGALAAVLLTISPIFQEYCLQEMLEVPGIFFSMLTLFFYLRFLQEQKRVDWQATCLSGIVLFFCKFNYSVIVMLPIVVCELACRQEFRRMVGTSLWRFVRDVRWRGGFTRFVILYIIFLFYINKVGVNFEIAGQRILIKRALGNPTYLLLAVIIVRNLLVNREEFLAYFTNIWRAPEPMRSLLRFDILPALVWLSYPVFFSVFFIFMFSEKTRQGSLFSLETLTFYPGAIIQEYAPHPVLGALSLVSLLAMMFYWKRLPLISRFFVGLSSFNLLLTILHPNYQIRYLLTSIPILYIVNGLAIVHLWEALTQRTGARLDRVLLGFTPVLSLMLLLIFPPSRDHLQKAFISYTQSEKANELFSAICKESSKSELNTLLGFSNYVAPSSIALQCYRDFPSIRREQIPTTMAREGFAGETSGRVIVQAQKIDRFFLIDYSRLGFDVGRLQEMNLFDEIRESLPGDFYEERELLDQGPGGYRVVVYRKKGVTGASGSL